MNDLDHIDGGDRYTPPTPAEINRLEVEFLKEFSNSGLSPRPIIDFLNANRDDTMAELRRLLIDLYRLHDPDSTEAVRIDRFLAHIEHLETLYSACHDLLPRADREAKADIKQEIKNEITSDDRLGGPEARALLDVLERHFIGKLDSGMKNTELSDSSPRTDLSAGDLSNVIPFDFTGRRLPKKQ